MPSKGVDVYSYVSLPDADVEFSVPGKRILFRDYSNNYTGDHLEVEYANTDIVGDGELKWEVHGTTNTVIASRSVGVNSLFGMMGGDHLVPLETPAIFGDDFCVCYGWYVTSGIDQLTKSHQCWVTVTPRRDGWMGQLAPPGSSAEQKPFSLFVLPSVHNAGMNYMKNALTLIGAVGTSYAMNPLLGLLAVVLGKDGLHNFAITQKESITDMLKIGTRSFDFRPAYLPNKIRGKARDFLGNDFADKLYHIHSVIPGISLNSFLTQLGDFLKDHPTEIVTLSLSGAGLVDCDQPSKDDLRKIVNDALASKGINVGWEASLLKKSIAELRATTIRVIVPENGQGSGTWDAGNHAAFTPEKILKKFETVNVTDPKDTGFNFGCALTPTDTQDKLTLANIATAGQASSPLMGVKFRSDIQTLKWIRDHALEHIKVDCSIDVAVDFVEGQTVETCVSLSAKRLGVDNPVPDEQE